MHYLEVNKVDNMAATTERKLQSNSYTFETRKWNFENKQRVHVDQHAILNGLREHGYSGIDNMTIVRCLTTEINTPTLDHVNPTLVCGRTSLHVLTCYKTSSPRRKLKV